MNKPLHTIFHEIHIALCALYAPEEATSITWDLLSFVTKQSKQKLLIDAHFISPQQEMDLTTLLTAHMQQGVPLAYLTQHIPFGNLDLSIRPPILIPRPETEEWCYKLIHMLKPYTDISFKILDLCTGSGCIALALAHVFPHATVIGVDISAVAIQLAQENKIKNNIENCTFVQSDLFISCAGKTFDIIVSNPPYISHTEWLTLDPSVRNFESSQALIADDEGYAIIQKIIVQAPLYLTHNPILTAHTIPQLYMEIGYNQAEKAEAFMQHHGYATIQIWRDYNNKARVVCGRISDGFNINRNLS